MEEQRRSFLTPGAGPFRQAVERRSAIVVVFLRGLPRPVPGLAVLGLLAVALLVPGAPGVAALGVVALLLAWLIFLSWPALDGTGRLIRLVALGLVLAGAVGRLTG